MFFTSWHSLFRILIIGTLAYGSLVMLLRGSGKRTLAKLNVSDLVVTVSLGSTLATILLSRSVALADGLVALGLLIGLQYTVAWLSVRWRWFSGLVKAEPTLLLHRGRMLDRAMLQERITHAELTSAVRCIGDRSDLRCSGGGSRDRWQPERDTGLGHRRPAARGSGRRLDLTPDKRAAREPVTGWRCRRCCCSTCRHWTCSWSSSGSAR